MAVTENGKTSYVGRVIDYKEHFWADGMLEGWVVVWNPEKHERDTVQVGYWGIDGQNLCGGVHWDVDVSEETAQDIIRTTKVHAGEAFEAHVEADKQTVKKGDRVRVVRGRKVPKGTELTVFWIGERPTYTGWGTDKIAGCWDDTGNKVWIKVEYLEVLTERPEPTQKDHDDFVDHYITRNVEEIVRAVAEYQSA